MPFKRLTSKPKISTLESETFTSVLTYPFPFIPLGYTRRLTPKESEGLSIFFPNALDMMLANEDLQVNDIIDAALSMLRDNKKDDVDWSELEHSSLEKDEPGVGIMRSDPSDCYGVPLTICYICGKTDSGTRVISCEICCKQAHTPCLQWTIKEDPRKQGHFLWHCSAHTRVLFLEG